MEHLFGDVWQRPGLEVEERSLITCAVLIALGREPEQRLHFRGARNVGHSRERLEELITHIAHYAGWPVAALMIWFEVVWALTSLEFWGLAGRLMNLRQGKRLFGLIGSGDMVATVIGGFSMSYFVASSLSAVRLWRP